MENSPSGDNQARLTGKQQQLLVALMAKNPALADLYDAALRIFSDDRHPARLILAAHSLRELADSLPKALDLPIPVNPALMTEQVDALLPIWNNAQKSECNKNGEWNGSIDIPLRKLLHKIRELFEWLDANRPRRGLIAIEMFRKTDPSGLPLPETLAQKRVKIWRELRRYFSNTAHGESTTADEFGERLEALERILFDSLCRTPSENLSAIDRILEEGSADA